MQPGTLTASLPLILPYVEHLTNRYNTLSQLDPITIMTNKVLLQSPPPPPST